MSPEGRRVAAKTVPEIVARLRFLDQVGLDYVTLDRPTRTLSGGEFQRARLAGCLGSGLVGVGYILDEPTIGLHPRDTGRLIAVLEDLRDQGNSVLVVEHDVDLMRRADWLIDLGPGAGREGGRIVAAGPPADVARCADSVTARFLAPASSTAQTSLANEPRLPRRTGRPIDRDQMLTLRGARLHHLQDVTVEIPLGVLTCVTGVSGSGKSSLITHTLVPAMRQVLRARMGGKRGADEPPESVAGPFTELTGTEALERLVEIDQGPIGRTARSCPATYAGVWDEIRRVFAQSRAARLRGYTARRFSFNAPQGRCPACEGQGVQRIEMKFMPDLHVVCPVCKGARFNRPTLAVRFAGRNVADVLALRFDEALAAFENFPRVRPVLQTFHDVGLGYLTLGQSSLTLSGGEAQRVKLATELSRPGQGKTLFVLDEPTTGLHPADIERLLETLQRLVDQGHTVLVIEHQLDVIARADWVIDLGPEGGAAGGRIVAQGTPDELARQGIGHTAAALRGMAR